MTDPIIIVGGGHAAAAFVDKYRKNAGDRAVLIISNESMVPYHRPPLSKKYLLGEVEKESLCIHPPEWYQEKQTEIRLNTTVTAIDSEQRTIELDSGDKLSYHKLILATGSRPRELPASIGGNLSGVLTLRDIADVELMKPYFAQGKKLLIIGGGYIGLEAAAVANTLEMEVTVVELSERILQRVAAADTSDYFRQLHRDHGVTILESTGVAQLHADEAGHVKQAELATGDKLDVDAVLVGIGGIVNTELAQQAGLSVDNGVVIDEFCLADEHIYAIGDCANLAYDNGRVRFESVQNANAQAALVAQNLANESGEPTAFVAKPWFWSDQYNIKLQIEGFNKGYDQVAVRQGAKPGSQSVWYFRDGKFIAVDAMSDPVSFVLGKKWLAAGHNPDVAKIPDSSLDLKTI